MVQTKPAGVYGTIGETRAGSLRAAMPASASRRR
jgi:hypothetical protein